MTLYKKQPWTPTRHQLQKTLIARSKREVPGFIEHFPKFEQQMTIGGFSSSALFNYSRVAAKVSLYFKKLLLDLDPHEVNEFLFHLAKEKKAVALISNMQYTNCV